jgi:hypothetical protein
MQNIECFKYTYTYKILNKEEHDKFDYYFIIYCDIIRPVIDVISNEQRDCVYYILHLEYIIQELEKVGNKDAIEFILILQKLKDVCIKNKIDRLFY